MVAQPCPDCGVLMNTCPAPLYQNEEPCWQCPNCGNTWTPEEIQQVYDLYEQKEHFLSDEPDTENRHND